MSILTPLIVAIGLSIIAIALSGLLKKPRPHGHVHFSDFWSDAELEVSVVHLTVVEGKERHRELKLAVLGNGIRGEISLGDGSDLLRELYEGRTWLYEVRDLDREFER